MDLSTFGKIIAGGKDLDCIRVGGEKIWEAPRVRSISGNAKQDGTPTSLVPIPYSSVGDLGDDGRYHIGARVFSKNFFDKNTIVWDDGKYLADNGRITTNSSWSITDYIPVSGRQFEFYRDTTTGNAPAICLYDSGKNFLSAKKYDTVKTIYISTGDLGNAAYARFSVYYNVNVANGNQKNKNATLRAYEDQDIILSEPLRKVGEYADELTPDGVIRRVFARTLDGQRMGYKVGNVGISNNVKRATVSLRAYIPNLKPISEARSVCSSDQYVYAASGNKLGACFINNSVAAGTLFIIHPDQSLATSNAVNAALAIEKPTFYIPIEDTLDTDFVWERPIYVEPGQTVQVLTALQPSSTIID